MTPPRGGAAGPVTVRRGAGCLSKTLIAAALVLVGIPVWLGVMLQTASTRPRDRTAREEALADRSPRLPDRSPPPEAATPPEIAEPMVPQPAPLRDLLLPVEGVVRDQLRDNFSEPRGGSRIHQAIDILAPRNTPVLAVADGKVAKLFESVPGGHTIYQFDPEERYCYYYAHLERYAKGLKNGDSITRGQVIGYVGSSGNAPPDTPHLHFAIYRLGPDRRWWEGEPLDPYPLLRDAH